MREDSVQLFYAASEPAGHECPLARTFRVVRRASRVRHDDVMASAVPRAAGDNAG